MTSESIFYGSNNVGRQRSKLLKARKKSKIGPQATAEFRAQNFGTPPEAYRTPRTPADLSRASLWCRKLGWRLLTTPGLRAWTRWLYPTSTISHLDVDGAVAFTVDDGFCGLDNPAGCMLDEVRALFAEHDARATFFVTGTHCEHTRQAAVERLLADGHELANHGMEDLPYHRCSRAAFAADLDATEAVLQRFRAAPSPFYRAPFGRLSAPSRLGDRKTRFSL